ncbi:Protein CBR-SMG-7 [Caenorhabditis briggsae]|uniref:Protein CBR-SMG-7 n=1 Tax=Caenorhabditis briggsae TaxID=6238 RepID=A8WZR2_CAEBR|nr:Protein CBR-SMG-7 [Caenorhabditis briggsae]CAP25872.2 Protein CBR-SMG-7 [Caenorhabditis briggsae]
MWQMQTLVFIKMTEEWEQLHLELKKLPQGVESVPQYLRHLNKMFAADFETSMSKRLDVKFWNKLKSMMNEMRKASEKDKVVDLNVQNLALGFLTDLSLLVHSNYEIPNFGEDISSQLTWTPCTYGKRKPVKSKTHCRVFIAYILLRMGDLIRYKEIYPKAKEYYEQSCRINPADGAVWNQLGLISVMSAKLLESTYFHTRALHATLEFPAASGSLTSIFKKFANRDISKPMPINELYLACLAKIHFLLEIENSKDNLQKISEKAAISKEMLIPLMSVYEHLEYGTEIEQRAVQYVTTLWQNSYEILLKTMVDDDEHRPEYLHLLAFYHSAPKLLENSDDSKYFKCLEKHQYPIKKSYLIRILQGNYLEESLQDESSEFDTSTTTSTSSPTKSPRKAPRVPKPESSDEECLQRGRRRGRAVLNESVDSDEEDF